jgi:hypothetical protein
MRTAIVISAVAILVVIAAGCGGDSDRLTRAEYVEAADAICRDAQQKNSDLGEPRSLEEMVAFLEKSQALSEEELVKLEALNPPVADEAQVQRARELNRQLIAMMGDLRSALEAADEARSQEIVDEANRMTLEADEIAANLGLVVCRVDVAE